VYTSRSPACCAHRRTVDLRHHQFFPAQVEESASPSKVQATHKMLVLHRPATAAGSSICTYLKHHGVRLKNRGTYCTLTRSLSELQRRCSIGAAVRHHHNSACGGMDPSASCLRHSRRRPQPAAVRHQSTCLTTSSHRTLAGGACLYRQITTLARFSSHPCPATVACRHASSREMMTHTHAV